MSPSLSLSRCIYIYIYIFIYTYIVIYTHSIHIHNHNTLSLYHLRRGPRSLSLTSFHCQSLEASQNVACLASEPKAHRLSKVLSASFI